MWNPESLTLESGIQLNESGIPLTITIHNPSTTDKESGIQYLDSAFQDCLANSLTWDERSNIHRRGVSLSANIKSLRLAARTLPPTKEKRNPPDECRGKGATTRRLQYPEKYSPD